jgi:hypothetical protein
MQKVLAPCRQLLFASAACGRRQKSQQGQCSEVSKCWCKRRQQSRRSSGYAEDVSRGLALRQLVDAEAHAMERVESPEALADSAALADGHRSGMPTRQAAAHGAGKRPKKRANGLALWPNPSARDAAKVCERPQERRSSRPGKQRIP